MHTIAIHATMRMTVRLTLWASSRTCRLVEVFRRWLHERATAAALHELDDAALKDLGICRCEIPWLARSTRSELDMR